VPHSAGVVVTVPDVVLRAWGRPHRTTRRNSVMTWPCKFSRKWFEGVAGPLRGRGVLAVRE
jgi:hypothetical protein